jgi:hypothetical protein
MQKTIISVIPAGNGEVEVIAYNSHSNIKTMCNIDHIIFNIIKIEFLMFLKSFKKLSVSKL